MVSVNWRERLQEALLDAFIDEKDLAQFVSYRLGEKLNAITAGRLTTVVYELIEWARSSGREEELIRKSCEYKPGNAKLRAFAELFFTGFRASSARHGDEVHKFCNRKEQEAAFNEKFLALARQDCRRKGYPQAYIIHGDRRESLGSLVERFRLTTVERYGNTVYGDERQPDQHWVLNLPYSNDPKKLQALLLKTLFSKADEDYAFKSDNYSPSAFRGIISKWRSSIIVENRIGAANWNSNVFELLKWYLAFWDGVRDERPMPQVLLFICIEYDSGGGERFRLPLAGIKRSYYESTKKRIKRELEGLCKEKGRDPDQSNGSVLCPCVMLEELTCVGWNEVMDWFAENRIGTYKYGESKCNEIFKRPVGVFRRPARCKNMADVEDALMHAVQEIRKGEKPDRRM